jgi:glycopeptide antibiotics resistance protein
MTQRMILTIVLVAYTVFLFDLALLQFPTTSPRPNRIPFQSIRTDWRHVGHGFIVNFLGNIVAFLPFGLLLPLIRRGRATLWQAALFALAISLTIEAGQYFSGRRVPDVDDLILNTLGGAAGFLAVRRMRGRATSSGRDERPAARRR